MAKQEKKMKKITVCQGAGFESHLWCWEQLTQTVKMNVGGAVKTGCPGPSFGVSPSLTSSSWTTQVLSECVPTKVLATLKTKQKSPSLIWHPNSAERFFSPLSHHKPVGEWRLISEVSTRILGHLHSRFLTWEGSMRPPQHKHDSGIKKTTGAGQTAQWLWTHVAHSEDPSLIFIRQYNCL